MYFYYRLMCYYFVYNDKMALFSLLLNTQRLLEITFKVIKTN